MSSQETRPRLVLRFAILTLVVTGLCSALLAFIAAEVGREQALAVMQDFAGNVGHHLFREIETRWLPGHPDLTHDDAALTELDQLFRLHGESMQIPFFVWFDPSGKILYCTDSSRIGLRHESDRLLDAALNGVITTEIHGKGDQLDLSRGRADEPLFEAYVPASRKVHPQLHGHVLEMYFNARLLSRSMASARRTTILACTLLGGVMFVIILTLAWRAQTRLWRQNLQLRELSDHLEQRVEEKTRELLRASRLAEVGTLSAGLAHEINNPLAVILSSADGLLDRLREGVELGQDSQDFHDYLKTIRTQTLRCKGTTQALLNFSRPAPSRLEHVDLRTLLRGALDSIAPLVAARHQHIELRVPDAPVFARVAGSEIEQVLVNLVNNAIDAGSDGQVIEVSLASRTDAAEIAVVDHGTGMSPEAEAHLFEPFFTTKPPGKGVGMGLAVSRHIADIHGGTLSGANSKDGGAVFTLTLPLSGFPGEPGRGRLADLAIRRSYKPEHETSA